MKDASASDLAKDKFAIAVRDFVPKVSDKWQKLLAHKAGIAELRAKGASYRTITDILYNTDVLVSHSTVARFCKDVLDPTPPRKKSRQASVPALSQKSPSRSTTAKANRAVERGCESAGSWIADPNDI